MELSMDSILIQMIIVMKQCLTQTATPSGLNFDSLVLDYFVIILGAGICLILLGCFCYLRKLEYPGMMMNRSHRNQTLPLAVRSSRKKTRVPYQKGFETKNPPLTDPQVVTVNPVQVPVQPIPESFVQNKPVYIQPTPPPKPVT